MKRSALLLSAFLVAAVGAANGTEALHTSSTAETPANAGRQPAPAANVLPASAAAAQPATTYIPYGMVPTRSTPPCPNPPSMVPAQPGMSGANALDDASARCRGARKPGAAAVGPAPTNRRAASWHAGEPDDAALAAANGRRNSARRGRHIQLPGGDTSARCGRDGANGAGQSDDAAVGAAAAAAAAALTSGSVASQRRARGGGCGLDGSAHALARASRGCLDRRHW